MSIEEDNFSVTKLLVLSDSHGARDAIKRILNKEQNNVDAVIIFWGDGLRDLEQALAIFPSSAGVLRGRQLRLRCAGAAGRLGGLRSDGGFSIRTVTCTV